jgi:tryptophan 7-halogenase
MLAQEAGDTAHVHIQEQSGGDDRDDNGDGRAHSSYSHVTIDGETALLPYSGQSAEALLRQCGGGFSLGTCLEGWTENGGRVFHAPGEPLPLIGGVSPHQGVLRMAMENNQIGDYSQLHEQLRFQARLAGSGRFAEPAQERQSPRSLLRPAVNVNGGLLTQVMQDAAIQAGAKRISAEEASSAAPLLVIDCRDGVGNDADGWNDMAADFGFDRCLTAWFDVDHDFLAHDSVLPLDFGFCVFQPQSGGMIASLCYDSNQANAQDASAALQAQFSGAEMKDAHDAPCRAGFLAQAWTGNHVTIGPAAARLGPIYGSDGVLLSMQISRLAKLLPHGDGDMAVSAAEYNRLCQQDFQQLSDFVRLPFVRNGIAHDHWRSLTDRPLSETLKRRIDQFESRGRVAMFDGEIYDTQVWSDMMIALGITPRRYDIAAGTANMNKMMGQLGAMVQAFDQTIAIMPAHKDYLQKILG